MVEQMNGEDFVARELRLEKRTFPSILERQTRLGDKLLINCSQGKISYQQAGEVAALVAGNFQNQGIKKSDRVAVLLPNCLEMVEVMFGTGWLGAILVPINKAFRGSQLKHLLELADPAGIVVSSSLAHILDGVELELPSLKKIWVVKDDDTQSSDKILGVGVDVWSRGSSRLEMQQVAPNDPFAILYTSGTTGPSKAVVCPHAQFYWWGILTGEALELDSDDIAYTVLPLFHTNALNTLWQILLCGATYCFGERFSASRFMGQLIEFKATVTYLLGSMVYIMLKQPASEQDALHSVKRALSPATSVKLIKQFENRFGISLSEGYGSTETNLVASNRYGGYEPGCMGRIHPEFEVRIVDELDQDVPDGEAGEMLVRNKEPFSCALGYFRNPEATVSAWRNLWFHTGDRIRKDERGIYHFLDRKKDAIRRRGENISSWEVEQALMSHADVENCAVVGVPSELGEEEVMAFVLLRKGGDVSPPDLINYLKSEIAYFAIPRYLEFVAEMPETENGKIQKFVLKERGVGENTWDREEYEPRQPRVSAK